MSAHHKTSWTEAEDAILRANPHLSNVDMAKLIPGRSRASCRHRRIFLGLETPRHEGRKMTPKSWTEAEDAAIRANYHLTGTELARLLPNRSYKACQQRRRVLGLSVIKVQDPATAAEDEIVRAHLKVGIRTLHAKLPHRSESWLHARRAELRRDFQDRARGDGVPHPLRPTSPDHQPLSHAGRPERLRRRPCPVKRSLTLLSLSALLQKPVTVETTSRHCSLRKKRRASVKWWRTRLQSLAAGTSSSPEHRSAGDAPDSSPDRRQTSPSG
jgi:hypothetical protein